MYKIESRNCSCSQGMSVRPSSIFLFDSALDGKLDSTLFLIVSESGTTSCTRGQTRSPKELTESPNKRVKLSPTPLTLWTCSKFMWALESRWESRRVGGQTSVRVWTLAKCQYWFDPDLTDPLAGLATEEGPFLHKCSCYINKLCSILAIYIQLYTVWYP